MLPSGAVNTALASGIDLEYPLEPRGMLLDQVIERQEQPCAP